MNNLFYGLGLAGLAGALGARKNSWSKQSPQSTSARDRLHDTCGRGCFLLPNGTVTNPGVPSYPICKKCSARKCSCERSCDGMKAAFSRSRSTTGMFDNRGENKAADQAREVSKHAVRLGRRQGCGWAFRGKAGEVR